MDTVRTLDVPALQASIERHIDDADAEFGVAVRHVQSGTSLFVHPDSLYPMASVFKVPILLEALAQVDEGERRLEERIVLRAEDQLPTSMILGNLQPGLQPTLRDLLTAMITVSDNTATDMVLDRVGAGRVMARLTSWGFQSITVHMGVAGLFDLAFSWPDTTETMPQVYRNRIAAGPLVDPYTGLLDERFAAATSRGANWDAVTALRTLENNVASPREMAILLEMLVTGKLLSWESTGVALDIMLRQQLNQRLPRYLPLRTPFAHKTGTFYSSRNDAGILYLPDGSRVVVVTFGLMRRDRMDGDPLQTVPYTDGVDSCMGKIARSVYDAFTAIGERG